MLYISSAIFYLFKTESIPNQRLCNLTASQNSGSVIILRSFIRMRAASQCSGETEFQEKCVPLRNTGISACAPSGVALRCARKKAGIQLVGAAGYKLAGRTGHRPVFLLQSRLIVYAATGVYRSLLGERHAWSVPKLEFGDKQKMPVRLATNGHLNCKSASSY